MDGISSVDGRLIFAIAIEITHYNGRTWRIGTLKFKDHIRSVDFTVVVGVNNQLIAALHSQLIDTVAIKISNKRLFSRGAEFDRLIMHRKMSIAIDIEHP